MHYSLPHTNFYCLFKYRCQGNLFVFASQPISQINSFWWHHALILSAALERKDKWHNLKFNRYFMGYISYHPERMEERLHGRVVWVREVWFSAWLFPHCSLICPNMLTRHPICYAQPISIDPIDRTRAADSTKYIRATILVSIGSSNTFLLIRY